MSPRSWLQQLIARWFPTTRADRRLSKRLHLRPVRLQVEALEDRVTPSIGGTLQDQINNAAPGSTITIAAGTYDIDLSVAKDLNLVGAGSGLTIIDSSSPALTVSSGIVTVSGMTFTNTVSDGEPAVLVTGGTLNMTSCVVNASDGDGIDVDSGSGHGLGSGTLNLTTTTVNGSSSVATTAAIEVNTTGSVNLGTIATPGNNVFNAEEIGEFFIQNNSAPAIAAIGNTFEQSTTVVTNNFTIENQVYHALDNVNSGLVTWVANNDYVTTSTLGIQQGIDVASSGFTVNVAAGTFAGDVTVTQSITLLGANAGVNPNTAPPPLATQTIVEPGATSSFDTDSVITVLASNVTIDGFTIQGSNAAPSSGGFVLPVTGVVVYAAAGISNSTDVNTGGPPSASSSTVDISGLVVQNNIVQDFTQVGIYGDTSDSTVSTGNVIRQNQIADVPANGQSGYFGYGVLLVNNFYGDVVANVLTQVRNGIQVQADSVSAGAFTPSISNNNVSAYANGIYLNEQTQGASTYVIHTNTITQADAAVVPLHNFGLVIQGVRDAVQTDIVGNNVSGFVYGVEFAGNDSTSTVTVQGGTLNANTYGVWATNNDFFFPAAYDTTAALDDVTITNSTNAGIWVDSTSADMNGDVNTTNTVNLAITGGTTVTGGLVGLLVDGALSLITGLTLHDMTFSGQSGNYITLAHGALGGVTPSVLVATGVTFDGLGGPTPGTTLAQFDAIENKISDYLDDPTLGYVTIKTGNVYVTQQSDTTNNGALPRGVSVALSGDTVHVQAGTFFGNVTVTQSITLLGANAGVNPNTVTRGAETVVVPGAGSSFDTDSVITVLASNVTIDGFTIQGSFTGTTPPAGQSTGFVLPVTGVVVYAAAGISNSTDVNTGGPPSASSSTVDISGLVVQNNIVQDFTQVGIYGDTSDSTVSTGNVIRQNQIADVPANGQSGYFGYGVLLVNNFYGDVVANVLTQVRNGIQVQADSVSAGAFTPSISNNNVSAYANGIYLNEQTQGASTYVIHTNTITQADAAVVPLHNFGLVIQGVRDAVQTDIVGNNVSGFVYGVEFAGNDSTSTVTVQGGTLNANTYGVWATNNDFFFPAAYDTTAALDDVTITNSTNAGIWVDSTSADMNGDVNTTNTVNLAITGGTTVTGGLVGLLVDGALSLITGLTLHDMTFSGQSGNYITLAHGALGGVTPSVLVATGVTFDGLGGPTPGTTLAQFDAIENKISDYLDDPTLGYVTIKTGNVYVTQQSDTTNNGALPRGVSVALSGDTVHVQAGTFFGNVTVTQSITLLGANAGVNPNTVTRGAETVVVPGAGSSFDTDSVITVLASNVTIDGFTIQGSFTGTTPPAGQSTGFVLPVTGVVVYAAAGISNSTDVNTGGPPSASSSTVDISGLVVQNNIVQDFTQVGIYGDTSDSTVSTGNVIRQNQIADVPANGQSGYFGYGVLLVNNFYGDVVANVLTQVRNGIQVQADSVSAGAFTPSISNNNVSAYANGIYLNEQTQGASTYVIHTNTITQADAAVVPLHNFGLVIQGVRDAVQTDIVGNNVSGFVYGVEFAGNDSTSTVTVQGGTLNANTYGVWATNNDFFFPAAYDTTAALDDVTITNSTNAGIWVDSTSADMNGDVNTTNTVNLAITGGTTVTGGLVGLLVDGALSLITGLTLHDMTFSGQSGNYITLAHGALGGVTPSVLVATGVTFDGLGGPTPGTTLAQFDAIENKISDYLDDPTLGYVTIKTGNVYVTQQSDTTNNGALPRGVSVALSGDTVHVQAGTFFGNVTVTQSITLLGANAGVNPNTVTRGAETVVVPGAGSSFDTDSVITVLASNVTIDGFTIQGSFTGTTPPAGQSTGFVLPVTGVVVYAAAGISNSTDVNTGGPPSASSSTVDISGLVVQNNIVQDFTQVGIYGDTSDSTVSTGNVIRQNQIADVPANGQSGYFGYGVLLVNNFYGDVVANVLTQVRNGIQVQADSVSAGAFTPSISNNNVSAYANGIYLNEQTQGASTYVIHTNTITQADAAVVPLHNFGLVIQGVRDAVQTDIVGNNVSGFVYGVEFAGNDSTSTVTVQGGTLNANTYGVWATNNDFFFPAAYDTTAALDDVTITNSTNAGIWVDSTSADMNGDVNTTNTVNLAITGGTTVTGGLVGLLVDGALSIATVSGVQALSGNVTLEGGKLTGNGQVVGAVTGMPGADSRVAPGTATPTVTPTVLTTDAFTLNLGDTFADVLNPSGTDALDVAFGDVNLGGATLALSGTLVPSAGSTITLIYNDHGNTFGTFNNQAEGSVVTVNGVPLIISYVGGNSHHDVVLYAQTTTVTIIANDTAVAGQSTPFLVTVAGTSGPAPTGPVTLFVDGTVVGTASLTPGLASSSTITFTTSTLGLGTHDFTAVYSGDTNHPATTSTPPTVVDVVAPSFSDPFNRATSSTLGDDWTTVTNSFSTPGPDSFGIGTVNGIQQAVATSTSSSSRGIAVVNGISTFDASASATVTLTSPTTSSGGGVAVRVDNNNQAYVGIVEAVPNTTLRLVELGIYRQGIISTLPGHVAHFINMSTNDSYGLQLTIVGTQLEFFVGGVLVDSGSDASLNQPGAVGIVDINQGSAFTNFVGIQGFSFTDTFNPTTVASAYAQAPGGGFTFGGGQAVPTGSGQNIASLVGINKSSLDVQATITSASTNGTGVVVQWNSATQSGFEVLLTSAGVQVNQVVGGVATQLFLFNGTTQTTGTLEVETTGSTLSVFLDGTYLFTSTLIVTGSHLNVYMNGSLVNTLTDLSAASFTSGSTGLAANGTGAIFTGLSVNAL